MPSFIFQLGRKPILLMGTIAVFLAHIMSASLILSFDLDNEDLMELSVSQRVASYFVLVTVCMFFGSAALSYGYVYS